MKLGVQLPEVEWEVPFAELIEMAQLAEAVGLEAAGERGGWFHTFTLTPSRGLRVRLEDGRIAPQETFTGHNVVGILRGSTRPGESVVVMAHYDHLGVDADGDVFNGALAVALSEAMPLRDAARFASAAAAISVTRRGAQPSAPHREEILQML